MKRTRGDCFAVDNFGLLTPAIFIQKLRDALIQKRTEFISDIKKYNIPLYESDSHKDYRSVETPWRVLDEKYMERRYTADDPIITKENPNPLCEITVCYTARGPFTIDQNIYISDTQLKHGPN